MWESLLLLLLRNKSHWLQEVQESLHTIESNKSLIREEVKIWVLSFLRIPFVLAAMESKSSKKGQNVNRCPTSTQPLTFKKRFLRGTNITCCCHCEFLSACAELQKKRKKITYLHVTVINSSHVFYYKSTTWGAFQLNGRWTKTVQAVVHRRQYEQDLHVSVCSFIKNADFLSKFHLTSVWSRWCNDSRQKCMLRTAQFFVRSLPEKVAVTFHCPAWPCPHAREWLSHI